MSNTEQHEELSPDRLPFDSVFSTVFNGWAFDRRAADGTCGPADSDAVRLIWLKNIGRDGVIAEPDPEVDDWRKDAPERFHLRAGDILLSSVISGRPKAALVQESDLPAVAVRSLFVLRPAKSLSPEHARLILAFLRSDTVGDLAAGSSGQQHLRLSQLKALDLPNEDQALSAALADLAAAGQRLRAMAAEAGALAESVFDRSGSPEEARRLIITTGQLTRLRSVAAAQLDDPDFIVRTRYPYPIALRWRNVEAQRSAEGQDDAQAKEYAAVLKAAETLLGYSALLTTALAHEAGITCKAIRAFKTKIATGPGGPGFGDWQRILQQIATAEGMSRLPLEHPLHELAVFLADDEAEAACRSLGTKRNSRAHGREDLPAVSAAKLKEAQDGLRFLLDRARFLADLQLLDVTKVVWDPHEQSDTVTFRRLMGDHPIVPTENLRYAGPERIGHILYLADRDQGLHPLSPFLTCEKCKGCAALSLFHADKEEGVLLQTSLDHGHFYPYEGDERALRAVGLQ
ncbi:restriction endonuclease [Streptomyces longhuiensis]|uniref:restriction endonuclease n=1 Tax=Streptomyces longhuiensis TaxID=2880933 RepID=UPI001D0A4D50|nr:restriction endonuclease [Streptomyces longhuiensis]UDM03333.1 restriction endonuclease [Streptomyces longhuiensis]